MSEKERPRPRLGDLANELANQFANGSEAVGSSQLEDGIASLYEKIRALEKELLDAKQAKDRASQSVITPKALETEMDQLHHELTAKMTEQHSEVVNLLNGVRYMLNVFGEDANGADVEELIAETNGWLDRAVKPIATSIDETERKRTADARADNENDPGRPDEVVASQTMQPNRDDVEQQQTMDLDQRGERDDGRDI